MLKWEKMWIDQFLTAVILEPFGIQFKLTLAFVASVGMLEM